MKFSSSASKKTFRLAGTVKWAARYSPFGEVGECDLNPAVDGQQPLADLPLRFLGQYDDRRKGTGYFYYNYHRYYDPAIGRYIQPDPLLTSGATGNHAYAYAGGNPIVRTDRLGLRFEVVGADH